MCDDITVDNRACVDSAIDSNVPKFGTHRAKLHV